MKLYHVTTPEKAARIRRDGFEDRVRIINGHRVRGVWFTNSLHYVPRNLVAVAIDFPFAYGHEFNDPDVRVREFVVPAYDLRHFLKTVTRFHCRRRAGGK